MISLFFRTLSMQFIKHVITICFITTEQDSAKQNTTDDFVNLVRQPKNEISS